MVEIGEKVIITAQGFNNTVGFVTGIVSKNVYKIEIFGGMVYINVHESCLMKVESKIKKN